MPPVAVRPHTGPAGAPGPVPAVHDVLAGLDDEQAAAVLAPLGPVQVLAGAGTGKTRTLVARIAYQHRTGLMPGPRVLAVTHSARAAAEMSGRLTGLGVGGVAARTFHGAALRQLRHFWSSTGRPGSGPDVLTDTPAVLRCVLAGLHGTRPGQVPADTVAGVAAEVAWAHARLLAPAAYPAAAAAAGRAADVDLDLVAAVYAGYEQHKADRGLLDYDDLLSWCTHLLTTRPEVAAVVRDGYRSFLVDEYQDTDPAQQQLLDAWLGGRDTVCVVGDPTQAIFSFKGADPALLGGFTTRYPTATTVRLVRSYRSTPQVTAAANAAAVGAVTAGTAGVDLVGQQPDGPVPVVTGCADETAEAAHVAGVVADLIGSGTPPSQVAVLHRFHAQAPALRAALVDAGVPVAGTAQAGPFTVGHIRRVLRDFTGSTAADPGVAADVLMAEALDRAGFDEAAPPAGPGARARWEEQRAVLEVARVLAGHRYSAAAAAAELNRRAEDAQAASRVGVVVSTIHAAKGLEWDAVVVARCAEGSLPAADAVGDPDRVAEEQRLFYVAVTRARRWLHLTYARHRANGRAQSRSRFLDLLPR